MTGILQLFLIFNVFVMGALAMIAFRHAQAHFRPPKPEPEKPDSPEVHLSVSAKERLLHEAEADFKTVLDDSAAKLHHELEATSTRLNKLVEHMTTEIVGNELERYRGELAQLRQKAEEDMGGIRTEIAKHEDELKARLAQELEAEKLRLIKQMDTKLADAVAAFLIETLQHNVDLGAQSPYLTDMLEEHKAELVKELSE